ncbi:MAG: type II toxin-antitoxin system death-on-curing family toxin [Paracoccaceae bacterium]
MTLADAVSAHVEALRYGGGLEGVSNIDNLAGAIGRPYHGYHRSIARKSAALLHGVASSHGFADANKRTAWLLTFLLIDRSGYILDLQPDDRIDDVAVAIVEGTMSQVELVAWFDQKLMVRAA